MYATVKGLIQGYYQWYQLIGLNGKPFSITSNHVSIFIVSDYYHSFSVCDCQWLKYIETLLCQNPVLTEQFFVTRKTMNALQ